MKFQAFFVLVVFFHLFYYPIIPFIHIYLSPAAWHRETLEPWGHVGCFVIGAYAGQQYQTTEYELVQEINGIRAAKGMVPSWVWTIGTPDPLCLSTKIMIDRRPNASSGPNSIVWA